MVTSAFDCCSCHVKGNILALGLQTLPPWSGQPQGVVLWASCKCSFPRMGGWGVPSEGQRSFSLELLGACWRCQWVVRLGEMTTRLLISAPYFQYVDSNEMVSNTCLCHTTLSKRTYLQISTRTWEDTFFLHDLSMNNLATDVCIDRHKLALGSSTCKMNWIWRRPVHSAVFTVRTQTLAQRGSPSECALPPDVQRPFRFTLSVVALPSF